jgi:hypothetical protein
MARRYVQGGGGGWGGGIVVATDVEYDLDTHVASKAGYRMFRGGVGFVHTNGAVCRVLSGGGGAGKKACACGVVHVA